MGLTTDTSSSRTCWREALRAAQLGVRSWECGVRSCARGGDQEGAGKGATVVEEQGVVEEQAADGGVLGG